MPSKADIANRAEIAAGHFAKGEFAAADAASRSVLELAPDHVPSLHLLGRLAVQLGAHDHAFRFFERVLKHDPHHATAQASLDTAMAKMRAPPQAPEGPRYLVIEAWGSGFWSDMSHVFGCLLLAEITGRIPVTHWGGKSLFTDGSADAFQCYFKPVSAAGFAQLSAIDGATFFPAKFSAADLRGPAQTKSGARVPGLSYLHRPEAIAISDFFTGV